MRSCTDLQRYGGLAPGRGEEQRRYFAENRIYTLQIEITQACRQGCVYCYAGSSSQQPHGLASEEIRGLLRDGASLGVRAIDWLGGDPLLRPDWHDLMAYARSLGLINNVWTSGLPLADIATAHRVLDLCQGGFVSVHLDSLTPRVYKALHRGDHEGSRAAVINGVENLLSLGKPADEMINCITYTALQGPDDAILTMGWWFKGMGLRTCLTIFRPAGLGAEWRVLEPGLAEVQAVCTERDRINYGEGASIGPMDVDKYYCGTVAAVTFTGDVTPCSVIREGLGNIRRTPFLRLVAEHGGALVHAPLHDPGRLPIPCLECDHNTHCWGCRSSAYNYGGDIRGLDPKCWRLTRAR